MKTLSSARRFLLLALLPAVLFLASCQNSTDPTNDTMDGWLGGSQYTGNLFGKVTTTGNAAVMGIEVTVGTSVAYTNSKGEFYFQQIPAEKRLLVTFRHTSYATTQKIVVVDRGRTTFVEASVLPATVQNLNAAAGGTVTFNGAKVTFPANALVDANGATFTGSATVKATFFDPTSAVFTGCFPGEFIGVRTSGSETAIESFGFIIGKIVDNLNQGVQYVSVQLKDLGGKVLDNVSTGQDGSFRFFGESGVSYTLEVKWYADSAQSAITVNVTCPQTPGATVNVGEIKIDVGGAFVTGRVVDASNNPLSGVNMYSKSGNGSPGQSRELRTGVDGRFTISCRPNTTFDIYLYYN
ncbi:MAG: hypothetical protein IH600_18365 [Bacteroidetes bacterium]|nr:hypothetical protein [Bacteroidota bacterium]